MGANPNEAIQTLEQRMAENAPDGSAWGAPKPAVQTELEIEIDAAEKAADESDIPVTKIESDITEIRILLEDMNRRRKQLQFIRDAKHELVKTLKGAVI